MSNTLNKIVAGAIFTLATVNFAAGQINLPLKATFTSYVKQQFQTVSAQPATQNALPAQETLRSMAKEMMKAFATSVEQKSMEHFRSKTSILFQNTFSAAKLEQTFAKHMEVTGLMNTQTAPLVFTTQPKIKGDQLIVHVTFETRPSRVIVKSKYMLEGSSWALVAYHVTVEAAEQKTADNKAN